MTYMLLAFNIFRTYTSIHLLLRPLLPSRHLLRTCTRHRLLFSTTLATKTLLQQGRESYANESRGWQAPAESCAIAHRRGGEPAASCGI